MLRGRGPLQSLKLTPGFNTQFSEAEGEQGERCVATAMPPYRRESHREVWLTSSPLPRSNQVTGRCSLLGQEEEEEEADSWAKHCLAKGEQEAKIPCIFSHKRGN